MKKLRLFYLLLLIIPKIGLSQCTLTSATQTGTNTSATTCVCPPGGGSNCDLIPDISIAKLPLNQTGNYTEYAQVCNPPCSGNDGRLRFGVSTPIIGYGPLETRGTSKYVCGTDTVDAGTVASIPATCPVSGLPPKQLINQRIYRKNGSSMNYYERPAGSMTYHASHGHQHIDDWGIYTLRTNNGDPNPINWPIVGSGSKLGFCLIDLGTCQGSTGYCTDNAGNTLNQSNIPNYGLGATPSGYSCSNTVQGITNGFMDTYSQSLDGMWINIPSGICNGTYYMVIQIDPYNYFLETDKSNNVVAVPITLTKQGGATPTITASGPTTFCTGSSVTLTASAALNYLWSTGATTQSITVNNSGSYAVTVNSSIGCSSSSLPIAVTVNNLAVTASAASSTICSGQSSQLSLTHNASGTTTVATTFSTNTQVFIPDNNATGVTSPIAVSGINPSTLSSGMVVSLNLNLTHTYDGDLIISLISPSGNQINLSNKRGSGGDNFTNTVFSMAASTPIANGTAPFTGSYIPDGSFNSLTGNVNGTWLLKVADVAAVDTGRIRSWSLTINNLVTATPTFSWTSNPAGFTSATQNPLVNPAITTTYNVVVTAANGCTGSSSISVNVIPVPAVTVSPSTTICSGQSTTLVANGATNYTWSPSSGLSATTGNSVTANPSSTTTYTVTGTNNGCAANSTNTVTVNVNANPVVSVSPSVSICNGASTTLTASGADSYDWTPSTGLSASTGNTVSANPSSTTTYTVTGTTNGCTGTNTVTVNVNANPVVSVSPSVSICNGASTTLTASGADSYDWSPSTGLSASTGNTVSANPSSTTTYTVTGTANGCTGTNTVTVNVNSNPVVSVSPSVTICNGASTTLTASGADSYDWSPSTGLSASTGNTVSANPSSTNTYTVTGTTNGCTGTNTVTVNVNANPVVSVSPSVSICNGTSTTLTASGADSYGWSPSTGLSASTGNTVSANPSSTTTYTVTGTTNGCIGTNTVTVNVNANPVASATSTSTTCGSNNGTATANATNGTAPYSYLWNTSATTAEINNLAAGNYTVIVTDANGCSSSAPTAVNSSGVTTPTFSSSATTVCAGTTVTLTSTTPGNGLAYQWKRAGINQSGATTSSYTFTPSAGSFAYSLQVTSSCGTSTSASTTITAVLLPTSAQASISSSGNTTLCAGTSVILSVPITNGFTYQWQKNSVNIPGEVNNSLTVNTAGSFRVNVYNSSGCLRVSNVITTTVVSNISASITSNGPTTICSGTTVTLSASPNGSGYSYQWLLNNVDITGATDQQFTTSSSGNYSCRVSVGTCINTSNTITVNAGANLVPTINYAYAFICNSNPVNLATSNYGTGYTYQWKVNGSPINGATNYNYNASAVGNYTVEVSNGVCSGASSVASIIDGAIPVAAFTATTTTACAGTVITLNASPSVNGYSYQWIKNSANISGATNSVYSFAAGSTASYAVKVSNNCGSNTSSLQNITVNPIPSATIAANGSTTFCAGGSVTFTATTNIAGSTYQWQRTNVNIIGATSSTLTATTTGYYRCIVTSPSGCARYSNVIYVAVNCRVNATNSFINNFTVFPNPVHGDLVVNFSSVKQNNFEITLTDLTGRIIMHEMKTSVAGENSVNLDLKDILPGVYMIVLDFSGEKMLQKIIVQ